MKTAKISKIQNDTSKAPESSRGEILTKKNTGKKSNYKEMFSIESEKSDSISSSNNNKIIDLNKNKIKIHIIGKNKTKKEDSYTFSQRNGNIQNEKQIEKGKHKITYSQDKFKKIPQYQGKSMRKNNFYYNRLNPNMKKYNEGAKYENNNIVINTETNFIIKDHPYDEYSNEENYFDTENEEENSSDEDDKINLEDIYNKITGFNYKEKISIEELKYFCFNRIPTDEMLTTNINIIKNNQLYDYNLEIIKNNNIYIFAKVTKYWPYIKITLYISDNYNILNNIHFSQISNEKNNLNKFGLIKVGKIVSNFLRNNFVVYRGNNKSNYIKHLVIHYSINFFGIFGIRKMEINKFENNKIIFSLKNSVPKWDYEYKSYKMNFNGRVKEESEKNFILEKIKDYRNRDEEDNLNILQCGKINDSIFALDFIEPLSPFDSFSIALSSLVYKVSCE